MASRAADYRRVAGFALVTIAFAVTQPLFLAGIPLMVLLVAFGPRNVRAAIIVGAIIALIALGQRGELWWFDRGWPLLIAGTFVWITGLRNGWSFSARALAAVALAAAIVAVFAAISPRVWQELEASMTARSIRSIDTALALFGEGLDTRLKSIVSQMARLQVAVFPALLGVSSLGALGFAVAARHRFVGGVKPAIGSLKSFRFNDHLIWIWLAGLALILAPVGQLAERVGSNAVVFMGALYVLRGFAVVFTLFEGVSILTGVLGGLIALLVTPLLVIALAAALAVGVGDTWIDVRERIRARRAAD